MQKHIKNYIEYFNIFGEYVPCEYCWSQWTDFHHMIYKSQWGKDNVENIACLCQDCHKRCHFIKDPYIQYEEIREIHDKRLDLFK